MSQAPHKISSVGVWLGGRNEATVVGGVEFVTFARSVTLTGTAPYAKFEGASDANPGRYVGSGYDNSSEPNTKQIAISVYFSTRRVAGVDFFPAGISTKLP